MDKGFCDGIWEMGWRDVLWHSLELIIGSGVHMVAISEFDHDTGVKGSGTRYPHHIMLDE